MKQKIIFTLSICLLLALSIPGVAGGKKSHPYDVYDHDMHTPMFEGVIECDTCHADPDSYGNRKKVNRLGCHICHNPPAGKEAPLPGPNKCTTCHIDGKFPKPESHKVDWIAKHQIYSKKNPKHCAECHSNRMFCIDCHKRRDTVKQRVHRRNFKYFHSIEARASPRRCDACHTILSCQRCHAGRGNSKR